LNREFKEGCFQEMNEEMKDAVLKMMDLEGCKRPSAKELLKHPYFN
jgi:serine/threonine protein kinase